MAQTFTKQIEAQINMKKLLTIIFLMSAMCSQATNYYVSGEGSDGAAGTIGAPWATISKVNSSTFAANDSVLFERGYTYTGGIIVNRSTINYAAYGTGTKPVISGLSTVSSWTSLGGNLYEASVTNVKAAVNLVLRDGAIQQVGRYPNTDAANGGYLACTAATTTSITGPALSSTTNWTGAEIAVRVRRWDISRRTVTSHSGGVVGFASMSYTTPTGFGYFFQRDSRTLDKDGEWWYDNANSKLRVYSTANPSGATWQISTKDTAFKNVGYNTISITNLAFEGAGVVGILNQGCSNITIKNCQVYNSGAKGIEGYYTTNIVVDSCNLWDNLGCGIRLIGNTNTQTATNNVVTRTCKIAGMEITGSGSDRGGITINGGSINTAKWNRVINSGYLGIEFQGNEVYVKYNYVDSFCTVRDDGAGIYTYEAAGSSLPTRTNRYVVSNIVLRGIGNNNGTDETGEAPSVNGIYPDEGTRTVNIDSNTIANIHGAAIHGNSFADLTLNNNIMYDNIESISFQRLNNAPLLRNINMSGNIHYPYRFEYRNLTINLPSLLTKQADIAAMGTLDNNYYYIRPGTDTSLTAITTYSGGSNYSETYNNFSYVTGTCIQEVNSTRVNASDSTSVLQYNATNAATTYTFSGYSKKDIYGTTYNNSATIPAWGSVIFLANGTTTPPPAPSTGNSTKWRKFRN